MNDAGELLATMRKRWGLSMSTLSVLAEIPVSTISRIEAGKIKPTWATMQKLTAAAGVDIATELKETGGDEPLARIVDRLEQAPPAERASIVARFPIVAQLAPLTCRSGRRIVERPASMANACQVLADAGQEPAVSGCEGFVGGTEQVMSLYPVVYVDDPSRAPLAEADPGLTGLAMFLLPRTANSARFERSSNGWRVMCREWALLDALGSPGRQSDLVMHLLREIEPGVRL